MEIDRELPPAYVSHHPDDLKLPSVPQQDVGNTTAPSDITLPDLRTVFADLPTKTVHTNVLLDTESLRSVPQTDHYAQYAGHQSSRTLPRPATSPRLNGVPRSSIESIISPSDTASIMSLEEPVRRSTSVVSLEDPDVRLAAEALSGLGNPDFARSPRLSAGSQASPAVTQPRTDQEVEPLLNLLVDAHPWVGGTINGSLSAYSTTKHYSPRFVQYGANLIERNIGSPVANTVSSVGRRTGVESGIRRYLGSRRPSDLEHVDSKWSKRRKVAADEDVMDVEMDSAVARPSSRRPSHEFLPAYRSSKPPSYREEPSPTGADRNQVAERPRHNRSWSTQLVISTSGLGVALSESSLKSLTYCVGLLTKATEHVETVMNALKMVLREYDQARESWQHSKARRAKEAEAGIMAHGEVAGEDEAAQRLAERIKQLCDDIWNTMKTVVNSVSTYAGGALPENARRVVKGQLMSIPQRWRFASEAAAQQDQQQLDAKDGGHAEMAAASQAEGEARKAAHRMIAFATEGLDMMAQVNGVVKITLQSAEDWLQSLGRRNRARDQEMLDADDQEGEAK